MVGKGAWTALIGAGAIGLAVIGYFSLQQNDLTRSEMRKAEAEQKVEDAEFDAFFQKAYAHNTGETVTAAERKKLDKRLAAAEDELAKATADLDIQRGTVAADREGMAEAMNEAFNKR